MGTPELTRTPRPAVGPPAVLDQFPPTASGAGASAPGTRRSRARRGEGGRLRDDILAAAEELLLASGDTKSLSIRAIASAVGVTPPSIYLHFADRNELVFAVCDRKWRELEAQLEAAVAGLVDPLERIIRRGRAYVDFGLTHPEHYRILLGGRADQVPENYADEALLTERLGFEPLALDLTAAMEAGQVARADPLELCLVLFFAIHGLTSMLVSRPGVHWPDSDVLVDRMIDTLMSGIRPRPA
jgi:AcrR family transcriptional regulator